MSFATPTPRQAAFELIFVAGFWGFGFVATQWALETWTPLGVLMSRFTLAFLLGEALHLVYKRSRKQVQRSVSSDEKKWDRDFFLALPAGLLLGTFLLLQTIGLQYTSASKSGFITTLYVLFVPFISWILFKKKQPKLIIALGLIACFGTYLLMDMEFQTLAEDVNVGDLWTLASALLAAGHIIYIGRIVHRVKDGFRLNNFQTLWALLTISPAAFINPELKHAAMTNQSLGGVVVLAAACSVFAFFVQVRAQKVLSETSASMLFLLESPYAFFFAYMLMGDRLTAAQGIGAVLILGAALLTVVLEPSSPTSKTLKE